MIATEKKLIVSREPATYDLGAVLFFIGVCLVAGACFYLFAGIYLVPLLDWIHPGAGAVAVGHPLTPAQQENFWAMFVLKVIFIVVVVSDILVGSLLLLLAFRPQKQAVGQ